MSKKGNMDVREKARVRSSHGESMTTTYHGDRSSRGDGFLACAARVGGGAAAAARFSARPRGALRVRPCIRAGAEGRDRESLEPKEGE